MHGWLKRKPNILRAALTALAVVLSFAFLGAAALVWPAPSGGKALKKGKLTVDAGNSADGYILVSAGKNKKRLKVAVSNGGEKIYYDLNGEGETEVLPLTFGNGEYTVALYQNAGGNRYSEQGKVKFKVTLGDEYAPFLVPNKWIAYTETTAAVKQSEELCAGLTDPMAKYEAVKDFIKKNFVYDFIKAVTAQAGTLPDIDACLSDRRGICQDLAALACCMLRVQGIPSKMAVGYADKTYHAWCLTYIDGQELFFDPTAELNAMGKVSTYTAEHYY
ncbi:MAG: transglutaminase-like domain-containing protein [Clostridia bacterium]|nr:transglutaminase-like domain-containing protein [Clostridia bacterium]